MKFRILSGREAKKGEDGNLYIYHKGDVIDTHIDLAARYNRNGCHKVDRVPDDTPEKWSSHKPAPKDMEDNMLRSKRKEALIMKQMDEELLKEIKQERKQLEKKDNSPPVEEPEQSTPSDNDTYTREELEGMSKKVLIELAEENEIEEVTQAMKKEEIIDLLLA